MHKSIRHMFFASVTAILVATVGAQAQSEGVSTYTASVFASGSIAHSSGVKQANRAAPKRFSVTFERDITSCVYVTSVFGATPGYATAQHQGSNPAVLFVNTYAADGTATFLPFSIIVSCGP